MRTNDPITNALSRLVATRSPKPPAPKPTPTRDAALDRSIATVTKKIAMLQGTLAKLNAVKARRSQLAQPSKPFSDLHRSPIRLPFEKR